MSCAYRHAAARIATIAGIPTDLMLTAMDIARQRRVTFPDLPPDRLRTIAPVLGITPTCGNPQQVIARAQSALIALGTLHPTHPSVERWMAIAAALLGVPEDHLPVPVHPEIMATVRAQWDAPPPNPAPDRTTAGIAALWQGNPIPDELIEEAIRTDNQMAIVTWMAYGVWDDRFTDMCWNLADAEIGILVRAGVKPDALVEQIAQRWWSDNLPWDAFPVTLWDRVANSKAARAGRARTAAAKLVRNPALRDDQLIAAVADGDPWYAKNLLLARPDLRTEPRLITAAMDPHWWAYDVLIKHPDRYTDEQLIAVAAQQPSRARDVLVTRRDLHDARLITAAAKTSQCARDVLVTRRDLHDARLIAAVANATDMPWLARNVLAKRSDLRDARLIAIVAERGTPLDAQHVLTMCPDLSDDRLIAAVAKEPWCAGGVLIARRDLSDDQLITAVATKGRPLDVYHVLIARPDLRTDARLLTAIARDRALVDDVLTHYPDLRDHPILTAVRHADGSSGCVMRV